MNLTQFITKVDSITATLSKAQLEAAVHNLARVCTQDERSQFLNILGIYDSPADTLQPVSGGSIEEIYSKVKKALEKIKNGELSLGSELNEEWDDWYNSDEDEYIFSDPDNLTEYIKTAITLLQRCIDEEEYSIGSDLARCLVDLPISVDGDYSDYEDSVFSLEDLFQLNFLDASDGDLRSIAVKAAYLVYMGTALPDRAEAVFSIFLSCSCGNLESVMQIGQQDLPDFDAFLNSWIDYLGNDDSHLSDDLLREAIGLADNPDALPEAAITYTECHPELSFIYLQNGQNDENASKYYQFGIEALQNITAASVIRQNIALMTASFACKMQNYPAAEKCWIEAFNSEPTVVNFMRIRFCSNDWEQYAPSIREFYSQGLSGKIFFSDRPSLWTMAFLDGDFENVMQNGLNSRAALGWSSTFMKQGIAFFLLLLYNGQTLPSGLRQMNSRAMSSSQFTNSKFYSGTEKEYELGTDLDTFWELLKKWKETVHYTEEDANKWLQKIERLLKSRTEGIMSENRRNYYNECAAFIAALGEVQESRGTAGAKQKILSEYASDYPRRRNFIDDLKSYGLRKR